MTCREASTLIATNQVRDESWMTRLRIGMHAAMCRHCRRFWRQLRRLDHGARAALETFDRDRRPDLPARILERIAGRG